MGPRVPFAPAFLTSSLHITLHINFICFPRLFILLYVTCVMVNKAVKKKVEGKPNQLPGFHGVLSESNLNSEMLVFAREENRTTRRKPLEKGEKQQNSPHTYGTWPKLNPRHADERRVLSPKRHCYRSPLDQQTYLGVLLYFKCGFELFQN